MWYAACGSAFSNKPSHQTLGSVLRIIARCRWSEEELGSEAVFRMDDEWSIESGPHWIDVALYCTTFCFHANIVVEGVTLSTLSDIFVGLKRT